MEKIALEIVNKIQSAGFRAYFAGGCVRDMLRGISPKDFDIVTSAKPEQIERLLAKTIPIGRQFGVMLAVEKGHHFEIATFRSEGRYTDARRPDNVFWANAKIDALRRDFTVNGLFYNPVNKKVIDYVSGQDDLQKKILRFIGDPDLRIKEDNLRILRAIRFKNVLGFRYDSQTWQAVKNNSAKIKNVSAERVRDELNKMLSHRSRAESLADLEKSSLLKYVLPEIAQLKGVPQPPDFHQEGDVFAHTLECFRVMPPRISIALVWAGLLHDAGKADTMTMPKTKGDRIRFNKHVKYSAGIATQVLRRLKFPNFERELIVWLVKNHMILSDVLKMRQGKQRQWLQDPRFPFLLKLHKIDAMASRPVDLSTYEADLSLYEKNKKLLEEERKKPKHKPLITGHDLIEKLAISEGPEIGRILKTVEEAQLEEKVKTKEQAMAFAKKLIK